MSKKRTAKPVKRRKSAEKRLEKRIPVLVDPARFDRYTRATEKADHTMTLSEWIRRTLDAECKRCGIE